MAANKLSPQAKDLAEYGGTVHTLLWSKLMGQLTAEQRDMLMTARKLAALSDAVHQAEPDKLYHRAETNLSHARILAEVQHGEQLLTGTDWRRINLEDRARMDARVRRACEGKDVASN
jgi:hypothetical protein